MEFVAAQHSPQRVLMSFTKSLLDPTLSRRDFLTAAVVSSAATATGACAPRMSAPIPHRPAAAGGIVLFQGDSITWWGRDYATPVRGAPDAGVLGWGYPLLIAASVLSAAPDPAVWQFHNRGVAGDTVADLQGRWDGDAMPLKPDIISVLIGANDYLKKQTDITQVVQNYETRYTALLADSRKKLPATRLIVLEPFLLPCDKVTAQWMSEFAGLRAAAARVAQGAGATFIPLHDELNRRAAQSRPENWADDGVHPMIAGHGLIAEQWRKATGI